MKHLIFLMLVVACGEAFGQLDSVKYVGGSGASNIGTRRGLQVGDGSGSDTLGVDGTVIVENGNVGIGTSNPATSLEVFGDLLVRNNSVNRLSFSPTTGVFEVEGIISFRDTIGGYESLFYSDGSGGYTVDATDTSGGNFFKVSMTGQGFYADSASSGKGLYVTPNANVGIGVPTPSEKLQVNGNALLEALLIAPNLPTDSTGLAPGTIWVDGDVLKVILP